MSFRNDVSLDEIPRVGTGTALVALRTDAGEAVQYTGPEDIEALVAFLGTEIVIVGGKPYSASGENLVPVHFRTGVAYVRPPAGVPYTLTVDELAQRTALVVTPVVEPIVAAWIDENHANDYAPSADPVVAGTVVYPPRPEKVTDLMAELEKSVAEAKEARKRTPPGKKPAAD